ncbi:hypothetical protein [Novosphingobium sp. AP12]|nr:hypothetical protein [Novosphingobium sp. AP12]EJL23695.1 hypothetical protein PMI02_04038 [Novosphingobium sp. AP12]
MLANEPKVLAAIERAVNAAIDQVGVEGVRALSMFPSSQKQPVVFKLAA